MWIARYIYVLCAHFLHYIATAAYSCFRVSRPSCTLQSLKVMKQHSLVLRTCQRSSHETPTFQECAKWLEIMKLQYTESCMLHLQLNNELKEMQSIIMTCIYIYCDPYRASLACYIQFVSVCNSGFPHVYHKGSHSLLTKKFQPISSLCCVNKISGLTTNWTSLIAKPNSNGSLCSGTMHESHFQVL